MLSIFIQDGGADRAPMVSINHGGAPAWSGRETKTLYDRGVLDIVIF